MLDRALKPVLVDPGLSPLHGAAHAFMTCERTWQRALVREIDPQPRDVILDAGCGNGTLAILLKQACPSASVHGTDSDPILLTRAETRARDAGVIVHFSHGFSEGMAASAVSIRPNKLVTCMALHALPEPDKHAFLRSAFAAVEGGGQLYVADYGEQKSPLMRLAFSHVQVIDGSERTRSHAEGRLPSLIAEAGFAEVRENLSIPTPSGSISIYSALRP
jgi:2-polyprenyl-3-methyl-5-hydroxy-6-metoxy-1,4-benzoquinol methylase